MATSVSDSTQESKVCGTAIAVETKLESKQVTVPLRMAGEFPLIMERTSSAGSASSAVLHHGKVLEPITEKERRPTGSNSSTPDQKKVYRSRSSSRKSHHEYINVGFVPGSTPPPLPPRSRKDSDKISIGSDDDSVIMSPRHSEGGIDHILKHVKMLEQRNALLEETNKKLRKENSMLNHQLQEVMKFKSSMFYIIIIFDLLCVLQRNQNCSNSKKTIRM